MSRWRRLKGAFLFSQWQETPAALQDWYAWFSGRGIPCAILEKHDANSRYNFVLARSGAEAQAKNKRADAEDALPVKATSIFTAAHGFRLEFEDDIPASHSSR